ncbi:hypothetical protein CUJ83_00315 [Methanocella sp. CWC-04]|uniref:Sulphur transport domain-containing protein n=1 Tax=Methanooceanicella nereidis TaxID=2052831 RepID=A0AAP2W5T4_9EURY|nr:YeeE/YedE thiosulfate transporter family protein [Methanocella sp. CWC-04]MCD1293441.1 hypothetical protein [Methanocella sp. CWC-04]
MVRYLNWFIAGLLLGLLNIFSYAVKKPLGVSTSFVTATGVLIKAVDRSLLEKSEYLKDHSTIDYQLILVVFMAIGGYLSSLFFGRGSGNERRIRSPGGILRQLLGGCLMLFGARIAKGCTSGNILSGVAQMDVSSLWFSVMTFLAGILTLRFLGDR